MASALFIYNIFEPLNTFSLLNAAPKVAIPQNLEKAGVFV